MRMKAQDNKPPIRAILSGAKVLEPLLSGLLRHPGLAQDPAELGRATGAIMALHREVTEKVHQAVNPDDKHPAAKAPFATSLAGLVAQAWGANPEGVDADALAEAYLQTIEFSEPLPDQAFDAVPRATDEALASARAVSLCLPTLLRVDKMAPGSRSLFVGKQDLAALTALLRNEIQDRTQAVSDALVPADTAEDEKWNSYKSIQTRVASLASQIIDVEYISLGKELQAIKKDAAKKQAFIADLPNHPRGVLVSRVLAQLDRSIPHLFPSASGPKESVDEAEGQAPS